MLKQSSKTTTQHVTTADLKAHLRVDGTDEDTYIAALCLAAQDFIERETGRDFQITTWEMYLPEFQDRIDLLNQPVIEVTDIKYYDESETLQTLDSADYHVMLSTNLASWVETVDEWPASYVRPDSVQISYTTGYDTLPPIYTHCVKLIVGAWFEHREEISDLKLVKLPLGVDRLLNLLSVVGYK